MKYLSVCSGIEAATVAWHDLGWTPVAFSEIEPFPSAVLKHHYPHVPNVGDMTKFKEWNLEPVNLLVGGTPCQSFSVAGLRKGLDDPRGNLMLTFLAIAERHRPRWIVWENVPGVLSSNGGRDFGTFLAALGELGYGWAFRVLDAQWFGVAQRRRRVFVVGCLGDQAGAATVLFESESVQRNPAPSRETGQGSPRSVASGVGKCFDPTRETLPIVAETLIASDYKGPGHNRDHNFVAQPVAFHHNAQASQLPTDARDTSISDALTVSQQAAVAQPVAFTRCDNGQDAATDVTPTMRCGSNYSAHLAVAQPVALGTDCYNGAITGEVAATIGTPGSSVNASGPTVMIAVQVRRLTPVECERLQGFPDGYTNIPWRKKPEAPDGPRYKALGNSMAVPCMKWIGERINRVMEMPR